MSFKALRPLLRAATSVSPATRSIAVRPTLSFAARAVGASAQSTAPFALRAFSSSPRRLRSGENDAELSAALAAEHAYEIESTSALNGQQPEFLQSFNAQGIWTIEDQPGSDDVSIHRQFGNETLKLTFQISDLDNAEPLETLDDNGNPIEEESVTSPYITSSLIITKSDTPSALAVDIEAGVDGLAITNVAVFEKSIALAKGAEGDWARRSKYMGPQFDTLDSSVQEAFTAYLAERGVDESLAAFIVSYSEYKEQKDYVSWLDQVKTFVDA